MICVPLQPCHHVAEPDMRSQDSHRHHWTLFCFPVFLLIFCACSSGGGEEEKPPAATTGSLAINVAGLPDAIEGAITVTGPDNFRQTLTGSGTLNTLAPGSYTLTAAEVLNGTTTVAPTPASQTILVLAGNAAVATVTYAARSPLALTLQAVATGMTFPVYLTAPAGDSRQFIVERGGRILVMENGVLRAIPFLDIRNLVSTEGEAGLLSMAFHPDYANNGYFFIYYIDLGGSIVIERMRVSLGDRNIADSLSGLPILTIAHPGTQNHYGGLLSFGSDGFLYAGTGDGGGAGDPPGNAQNRASLLGKLLRINVNQASPTQPYLIPGDNPFIGLAGARGEIWAYGLRNPWRYAFYTPTSLLYIADVGQSRREEIDIASVAMGGSNFGWNIMEGSLCLDESSAGCNQSGLSLPVQEYAHGVNEIDGCSVTGGYVYRGSAIPELTGRYLYSDYCGGWLKSFVYRNGAAAENTDWGIPDVGNIVSFGQDGQNELYLLSGAGGVWRIVRK
jgi:glucose/arabinose dehydrogenase